MDNLWFNGRASTSFICALVAAKKPGLVPCISIVAESAPRFHPSWCGFFISHEVLFAIKKEMGAGRPDCRGMLEWH